MPHELQDIADTWLRHHETRSDNDFWAWEEAKEIICSGGNLHRAWSVTTLLLETAKTDDEVGAIAAGPLEDLIDVYGDAALDLIEEACKNNSRLRLALSKVDVLFYYSEFNRWYDLLHRYGLREHRVADPSVIKDVVNYMASYLNGSIGPDVYGRSVQQLLDKPFDDKPAQRILQAAHLDIEMFQIDALSNIPVEFRRRPPVHEPELRAKVAEALAELRSLGYADSQ